jgi:hypothetical protein
VTYDKHVAELGKIRGRGFEERCFFPLQTNAEKKQRDGCRIIYRPKNNKKQVN